MPYYISKVWGYEQQIANFKDEGYCGKILRVMPGWACSVHFHAKKHETFYLTKGQLFVELWDIPKQFMAEAVKDPAGLLGKSMLYRLAPVNMIPGEVLILPPFTAHRFQCNKEPAEFIEFSTYDDPADSYRVVPSGPLEGLVHV